VNLDYRPCADSLGAVVAIYDHVTPLAAGHAICVEGLSAGGHLALMLAVYRPEIRCVMAFAATTDLPALAGERTAPSSVALTGAATDVGPMYAYNLAVAAFGRSRLAALSPALQAKRIRARVLLAIASNDIFVPWAQAQLFDQRRPADTHIVRLPVGRLVFVHGTTTAAGLQMVDRAERQLVAGLS
jgi:dipeptidyl aminopeptidase/acylaminoacyl peptidase